MSAPPQEQATETKNLEDLTLEETRATIKQLFELLEESKKSMGALVWDALRSEEPTVRTWITAFCNKWGMGDLVSLGDHIHNKEQEEGPCQCQRCVDDRKEVPKSSP